MATKQLITLKAECFQANKNKNGSNITFAVDIKSTEKGPAARRVISVNMDDPKLADQFETGTGKQYTITITD